MKRVMPYLVQFFIDMAGTVLLSVYIMSSLVGCFLLFYLSHDAYTALGVRDADLAAFGTSVAVFFLLGACYVGVAVAIHRRRAVRRPTVDPKRGR
ncbi:hypothetical protein F1188_13640 [Roseospira marina]|uniref:Uncharacterized protein n=1 Tax=Roseospira marina TaxID=140057 RepID=A0A5M6I9J8_9PROT|nr:hypothetical protein [Roseospira marina]KAA5604863.1 hypothetical protein F1188_13640 [Roseospira marina]MBB4315197.1 hypothetical protein [Roseospira marina]MBB5088197.1 threonine/homoserine/homoserine lactone efflux protein [Roseospira marina]